MARAADQFRSSDLTVWGIVALVSWAAAILAANVSGLLPASVFAALHASRLEGGTVNQVRAQLVTLEAETARMRRENNLLLQRLDLAEQARTQVTQRVGALEKSLPQLLERMPEAVPIDNSVTASILDGRPLSFDTDGGSVRVEQRPLVAIRPQAALPSATDPAPASTDTIGVALGFPVDPADAESQWQAYLSKVGTLLIGLWPVLASAEGADGKQVIAGPLSSRAQAGELCARMDQVGIPCEIVPFVGEPLPLLN